MPRMQRPFILLAAVLALLAAAPSAHAAKRKVPRGFFSVMWDRAATEAPAVDQEAQWALMAQSGVEAVRTVFSWAKAQPQPGVLDFSYTDQVVSQATRHRIELVPVVRTAPAWAKLNPFAPGSPPRNVSDYAVFVQALIGRYGPHGSFWIDHPELPKRPLRTWQIWNEPHLQEWWNTEGRSPNAWAPEYAALLKTAKKAIDAADPGATVVLAALADYAWKHMARLNRYGIGRYYDVAAINLFTARPASVMRGVRYVRRVMRRGGARRKPVWLTESTWPAGKGRVSRPAASWQRSWYTTDKGMAKRVRAVYSLAVRNRRKLRLGRVVWYTWSSAYNEGDLFDYSGLLRYTGGVFEQRPALAEYAKTARRYEGCRKTAEGLCR
jgi:polysaccharide biosynthesis protein PslG